ncbi:4-hydroxybenzoate polyprenyltransferase, mitochondrial [Aphelenchoides besseyi]|nr:4-hydroxybenzoate polyprenyltransferase, mitochondrial [Aphelenchoides besseyi]KAI6237669.1 4-hydroxybenzoate polyprenyltransferase, mitochondrial [Aphelenchoides besseyi]
MLMKMLPVKLTSNSIPLLSLRRSEYLRLVTSISTSSIHRTDWRISKWKLSRYSAANLVESSPKSLQPYLRLMRFDKPIGTWLLYWPCTWSIALAAAPGLLPSITNLALFGVGAVCMRGAGCVINDLWDKDYDRKVERTKIRPLASGELTSFQATGLLAGLLSTSLAILLQLNWLTVGIGCTSMLLVCSYPLAKRFTHWPQAILGLTFNYGAIMGYTAAAGSFSFTTIVPLYAASICWTMIYDTIYAHQVDKADDSLIGVGSTALRFGDQTKVWLSAFGAGMIGNLGILGTLTSQPSVYYVALSGVAAHLIWQIGTVNINNSKDCWKKFRSNAMIGPILFVGIVIANLIRTRDTKKQ